METFLNKVAQHLVKTYGEQLSELCIVFPNRRAGLFFQSHLSRQLRKTFISPAIFSIEDFIEEISHTEKLDPLAQLFIFYEVYCETNKTNTESFEEFSKWAPTLLTDYNEIDSYLADAKSIFGNLKQIKELENWSLGSAQLTDFQKKYLTFWESLGRYYEKYTERLKKEHLSYQGLSYRIAAEQIEEKIVHLKWDKIIFAGFNALTLAEEKIIKKLIEKNKAEILWDCDSYYLNDRIQEAGKFLRKHKEKGGFGKQFNWQESFLENDSKEITIIGVPKNIAQVKLAGDLINNVSLSNPDLSNTAVVLADEKLLIPLLNSFPEQIENLNVTMGYPLKNSPLLTLTELLFDLQENSRSSENGEAEFYHRHIQSVVNHPLIKKIITGGSKLLDRIKKENIVFISRNELLKTESNAVLSSIFTPWKTIQEALHFFDLMILELRSVCTLDQNKNTDIELEFLYSYSKIVKQLKSLTSAHKAISTIKTLRSTLVQIIRSTNLSFYGEPLSGLQVMGMLETRTLDFENIILLSVNEAILPAAKQHNSFIPVDVKKAFGLPTYSDKDAIYAFHFYRLLQRAKNIYLIYNTEADILNSGEKSRFIAQLQHELATKNPKIKITEKTIEPTTLPVYTEKDIVIKKDENIFAALDLIAERGYSPTLLNKFRNCSLQFYFSAIAKLREEDEVKEVIESDSMGSVIHNVLEGIYKPFVGRTVNPDELKKSVTQIEELVFHEFEKLHDHTNLTQGKNLLIIKVAAKYISTYLLREIKDIELGQKGNMHLSILDLEVELNKEITVLGRKIKLKGKADRIDQFGSIQRIIDYKTGKADSKELNIKSWEELIHSPTLNKSFQLLMYAWLYGKPAESGIISFRDLKSGLKKVKTADSDAIDEDTLLHFGKIVDSILSDLYDVNKVFEKTNDQSVCEYCDFKSICSR